jgi:hypothetical protein
MHWLRGLAFKAYRLYRKLGSASTHHPGTTLLDWTRAGAAVARCSSTITAVDFSDIANRTLAYEAMEWAKPDASPPQG